MRQINWLWVLVLIVGQSLNAQEGNWCGFDPLLEDKIEANPDYMNELQEKIKTIREQNDHATPKSAAYTIPVVFHVIHDGGPGNISMEQIQSGIDVMNEDFAALNADAGQIRNDADAPFAPLHANVDVEFKLAKRDPQGNCTNGIQRRYAPSLTNEAGEDCKYSSNGGLDAWPNDSYLNIWVVNSIGSNSQGTTLGYAYLPYNNWDSGHGILNRHDRVGRIGTASNNDGRTLTHEMGHICGLFHTFQDGCHSTDCSSNGDFICDTPPAEQTFGCLSTNNTCNDVPVNDFYGSDVLDMNENHMSYNSCRFMFSEGQKTLMNNNFETIPNFISLTSAVNLTATGVNEPDVICEADFDADKKVICVGQSVDFNDMSYHGASTWDWSFPGGSPSSSTDQNPVVTYNTPGVYEVTLTASDGTSSASETKTAFIKVLDFSVPLPFYESFENVSAIPNDFWVVDNPGNNAAFELKNVGLNSSKSAGISNFGEPVGAIDELVSSPIDLSQVNSEVTLSFRYAYRKRYTANDEWLRVFISYDCGELWAQRKTLRGSQLSDQTETNAWEPQSEEDWVTVHMTNVTSSFWVDNFRVKFQFESDNGNNFYVDDINIYEGAPSDDPVVGVESYDASIDFSVYPNPTADDVHVEFSLDRAEKIDLNIRTVDGRVVQTNTVQADVGKNLAILDMRGLSKGVYWVEVKQQKSASRHVYRVVKH
ncbi:MAG: M43 family zinc metalloprotease [Bacteroidota bacterium]